MKQSQELSNLKSSDEDYFDSIFGFDDHALENLPDDLIIIADRVIRQWHRSTSSSQNLLSMFIFYSNISKKESHQWHHTIGNFPSVLTFQPHPYGKAAFEKVGVRVMSI